MKGCTYLGICALFLFGLPPLDLKLEAANVVFVGDVDGDELGDGAVPEWAAADASMVDRLTNVLGHTVTSVDDSQATAAAVAGADFIVLSATASSNLFAVDDSGDGNSGAVNALGTSSTIILMESGNAIQLAFGLAGATIGPQLGTDIEIEALDGYLTKGFDIGTLSIYDDPEFGGEEIRTFGVKPPNGTNVGYPQFDWTGETLLGIVAGGFEPVALGTHHTGDNLIVAFPFGNGGFTHLTADGLKLFDNAFSPPVLPGDHNRDGKVDAADYVLWRKNPDNFGGTPDGYDAWRANFGAPGGLGAASSVPEPATALLAMIGIVLFGRRQSAGKLSPRSVAAR
jgi:hypothetical protein